MIFFTGISGRKSLRASVIRKRIKVNRKSIKNFLIWLKKQQKHSRPLKVFFEDEGISGRMSNPVKYQLPPGVMPLIPQQRVREYICAYTAVSPDDGENFSLILPCSNTILRTLFNRYGFAFSDLQPVVSDFFQYQIGN
jgi:hypothetical protein